MTMTISSPVMSSLSMIHDRFSDNNVTEFAFDLLLVTCLLQVAFAPPLEQLPVEVDMDLGAESSTSFPFF